MNRKDSHREDSHREDSHRRNSYRKNSSGSGMFLMEMMVVVLFFILCASVCILAYAKSDHASRLAADRNQAVSAAQSLVEIWKLSGREGLEENINAQIGSTSETGSSFVELKDGDQMYVVYWDQDWNVINGSLEPAAYYACMIEEPEVDGLSTAWVVVYRMDWTGVKDDYEDYEAEELFALEAKKYRRTEDSDG